MMGCGFLPPSPNVWPWEPNGRVACADEYDPETRKPTTPVCAGYVCALPEVIEASHAYFFLKNGGLTQFTGNEPPSEALLSAVTTLETEHDKLLARKAEDQARANQR